MYNQTYHQRLMDRPDHPWGPVMMLACLAIITIIIVLVVKLLHGHTRPDSKATAVDIVKERYAKGEIKKDEFEQIKKDLK